MASQAEQLRQAAAAGQTDKIRELLLAGTKIEPDLEGRTALHRAAANGHLNAVKALLDAGANINARDVAGYTSLHQAATEGHEEIVQLLLKHGCRVDAQDEMHGNTALHEAAWKGYSRTVDALCKHKANVYIKNNGGFTPLHLTCQNGHNQSCRVILLSACKPDVRNSYGDTPLHTAARYGHAGVLRILISAFCSVSETNKNGDTALHISAAMGKRKLTKILMEASCDQKIKNNQGETARDIAQRKGFTEVMDILDNPPMTLIPVIDTGKNHDGKHRSSSKKQEKDSGTSQESASKHKKDKSKKNKKKHSVHFYPDEKKGKKSPYGCHMYPNLEFFPSINIKSLPEEPLRQGEQYYADLAGNIKKGPRGLGYMCYCAPFFNHVENKINSHKNELMKHIDDRNEDLKAKLIHLERRTHDKLFSLNQRMKESLALERAECSERMDKRILRERLEMQKHEHGSIHTPHLGASSWMHQNGHVNGFPETSVPKCQIPLTRSKSADLLSETDSHQWTTDVTSNNDMPPTTLSNGSFFNYAKQRFYASTKNNGARPKNSVAQSPKMSRWKAKCYGNSILTRDSRSEGDLTSCHTEATEHTLENTRKTKRTNTVAPNHVHNPPTLSHKMQSNSPGALWNRNHVASTDPSRAGVIHGEKDNQLPRTLGCNNTSNHAPNDYPRQQSNATSVQPMRETCVSVCPRAQSSAQTNQHDIRVPQGNGTALHMQADDSSFV